MMLILLIFKNKLLSFIYKLRSSILKVRTLVTKVWANPIITQSTLNQQFVKGQKNDDGCLYTFYIKVLGINMNY